MTSTVEQSAAVTTGRRTLFETGRLRCPNDKRLRHITAYRAFEVKAEFAVDLNVVLRCADCGHVFSPALSPDERRIVMENSDA